MLSRYAIRIVFTGLFAVAALAVAAQPTFKKYIGGAAHDEAHGLACTPDGGWIVTGLSMSYGDTLGNTFLTKLDANGNQEWVQISGGSQLDGGNSVACTPDGGYLVTNHTESYGAGDCDAYIFKTDANGNPQWNRTYGGPWDDVGRQGIVCADGRYAIVGLAAPTDSTSDIWLATYDTMGELIWAHQFGGLANGDGNRVLQTPDGGFVIVGSTSLDANGPEDLVMLKTDADGNQAWRLNVGDAGAEEGHGLARAEDGGFFAAGLTTSPAPEADAYLVKVSAQGNLLWTRHYGGAYEDRALDMAATPDGGCVLVGLTKSFGDTLGDVFLLKADADGNQQWLKTFGGDAVDFGIGVVVNPDGGYTIAGYSESDGHGDGDAIIVRTDATGSVITDVRDAPDNAGFDVYPNPAHDVAQITASVTFESNDVQVRDDAGRLMSASCRNGLLDVSTLPKGVYEITLRQRGATLHQQLIKQ